MKTDKPEYKCTLLYIKPSYYHPDENVAVIHLLEEHQKLGPIDPDTLVYTSFIVEHDKERKRIETRNSIYIYENEYVEDNRIS